MIIIKVFNFTDSRILDAIMMESINPINCVSHKYIFHIISMIRRIWSRRNGIVNEMGVDEMGGDEMGQLTKWE